MTKRRTTLDTLLPKPTPVRVAASKPAERHEGRGQPPATSEPPPEAKQGRFPQLKQQTVYLSHPMHRQIRRLAFEEEKKMHDLWLEAIDMLFADRGLPSRAELESE
jgi:hypothetical protein